MAGRQGNVTHICNVLDKNDMQKTFKFRLVIKIWKRTDFLKDKDTQHQLLLNDRSMKS